MTRAPISLRGWLATYERRKSVIALSSMSCRRGAPLDTGTPRRASAAKHFVCRPSRPSHCATHKGLPFLFCSIKGSQSLANGDQMIGARGRAFRTKHLLNF